MDEVPSQELVMGPGWSFHTGHDQGLLSMAIAFGRRVGGMRATSRPGQCPGRGTWGRQRAGRRHLADHGDRDREATDGAALGWAR